MNGMPLWIVATLARLSPEEHQVLQLIRSGKDYAAAAQQMGLSPEHVEATWESILERFRRAHQRAQDEPFLWRAVG
jgi:DNA-binding NarL/FixJ family response regulator